MILINPDCRDGKHALCMGGLDDETGEPAPCPCDCHALCLEPVPEHILLQPRVNSSDRPVKNRPDNPVCLKAKGHMQKKSDWHDAGYGLSPWQDTPPLIVPATAEEAEEARLRAHVEAIKAAYANTTDGFE